MINKLERLQKVLAHAGVASRRASERLIEEGRVTVNGMVITKLGTKVDPDHDVITVDGELLANAEPFVYIALNKPVDVISTTRDDRERGRLTLLDLVEVEQRVYPVGRLDRDSEGLILLTNDGALAEQLTHPRYHLQKEYHVLVMGKPSWSAIEKWRSGEVELEDEPPLKSAFVRVWKGEQGATWLKVILTEGRKRQIRRVADKLGYPVKKLKRVRVGPIHLGTLKAGHWRMLSREEVRELKKIVTHKRQSKRSKPARNTHRKKSSKMR